MPNVTYLLAVAQSCTVVYESDTDSALTLFDHYLFIYWLSELASLNVLHLISTLMIY